MNVLYRIIELGKIIVNLECNLGANVYVVNDNNVGVLII